jgi:tRNASer (uridine44-2'-O)-methyltransferase
MWLGYCGLLCGWHWEKESLRIPSTRGWAIVARRRWATAADDRAAREWALGEVDGVRARGAFVVRMKEGKEH